MKLFRENTLLSKENQRSIYYTWIWVKKHWKYLIFPSDFHNIIFGYARDILTRLWSRRGKIQTFKTKAETGIQILSLISWGKCSLNELKKTSVYSRTSPGWFYRRFSMFRLTNMSQNTFSVHLKIIVFQIFLPVSLVTEFFPPILRNFYTLTDNSFRFMFWK